MMVPLTALAIGVILFLFFYRTISLNKISELNKLSLQKHNLQEKYDFLRNQKKELQKDIEKKKQEFLTLQNNQEGIRTVSSEDLPAEENNGNEQISQFLIKKGKITLEQNEKVLKKMSVLQMDYLGVCVALGIIDITTAKQAMQANPNVSKTTPSK